MALKDDDLKGNNLQDNERSLYLPDEAATLAQGAALANALTSEEPSEEPGDEQSLTLFLTGGLGAGKTTFCRGLLQALGHRGAVKSPTYTLVETYDLPGRQLHHFDLYRLGDPEELEYMGIRDYFEPGNLCLLEWPERGQGFLPEPDLRVKVSLEGQGRRLSLEAVSPRGQALLGRGTLGKP